MELRVLEYFLAVAREETISNAAKSLYITQPTLSRQIKDLEEKLGKTLFIRGNKHITLTQEGRLLKKRAEEIVRLVEKTEAEISADNEEIAGEIHLGCAETAGFKLIADIISQLQKDYPHIKFNIYSGNAEDVADRLNKGLLDFGLLIEPTDLLKYDFLRLPVKDTWGVLMRKNSPLAKKDIIRASDLYHQPVMLSSQKTVCNEISGWIGGNKYLNVVNTYNLIYNASIMAKETGIYVLCIDNLINTTGDSPFVFRELYPKIEVGINLVWKKYPVFTKASEKFLEYIKKGIND